MSDKLKVYLKTSAKEEILTEVFSRVNINRAQATLSLWEKRK
jgi:hypothetical protein